MDNLLSVWSKLDARRKFIVMAATVAVFAAVIGLSRGAGSPTMSLLYSGLESQAAGDVIAALDQRGIVYEVRGSAIFVPATLRDQLRMTLASDGLPANSGQGYELLDGLSGFGTTSQMFDAAYWRAKEGELARTILSSPHIRTARVHISTLANRPFQRGERTTAAVTVTTNGGQLSAPHAKALRYLVASAVSGLSPEDVAVIDGEGGLIIGAEEGDMSASGQTRAEELRSRAERLLEARVGYGNVVVELSLDTVTESETIVERRLDPEGRIAISTEVEERSSNAQGSASGDVTVASNLPGGDAAGGAGSSTNETSETRALTNYEVSEIQREVVRAPGAVRRMTVAVLVNDVVTVDAAGTATTAPRTEVELASMRDLVASAVGLDETRGDVITIRSMGFESIAPLGSEAVEAAGVPLDMMSLAQLGIMALVALVLGLFVVRPILMSSRPPQAEPLGLPGPATNALPGRALPMAALSLGSPEAAMSQDGGEEDPVTRLRRMIEDRQDETIQILQSWIEDPEEKERA